MSFATQEHLDRMAEVGAETLAAGLGLVGGYTSLDTPKLQRDAWIGRELAMSIFLAARGDETINRISLIEGFGLAIGECLAQQPEQAATAIIEALRRGLTEGQATGRAFFQRAGIA